MVLFIVLYKEHTFVSVRVSNDIDKRLKYNIRFFYLIKNLIKHVHMERGQNLFSFSKIFHNSYMRTKTLSSAISRVCRKREC